MRAIKNFKNLEISHAFASKVLGGGGEKETMKLSNEVKKPASDYNGTVITVLFKTVTLSNCESTPTSDSPNAVTCDAI